MQTSDALEQLIKHRESQWNITANMSTEFFTARSTTHSLAPKGIDGQHFIDYPINDQWLFTVQTVG